MVNLLRELGPDYVEQKLQRGHEQRARVRAGSALAGGDYGGASRELYGAGMLAEGSEAQVFGQGQEDRVSDQEKARKAEALGGLVRVSGALEQIMGADPQNPDDPETLQKRHQVLTTALPLMEKIGINTEVLRNLTPDQLVTQNLRMFSGNARKELEQYTLSPGSKRYDAQGKLIAEAPFAPNYQTLSEGQVLVQTGGEGGAAGSPQGGGSAPRNQRNNNPGNIEDGAFAKSLPGYKGSDGRFAIFESPDAGRAAQTRLLASYGQRGFNTVSKVINRWAPPSDNNPTGAYVQFVAQKLGVDPNTPLDLNNPQVAQALAGAIEQFEGGGQSASNEGGGARVIARGAPKPADTSKTFTQENQLRTGFGNQPAVKDMAAVKAQIGIIGSIAKKAASGQQVSAADDLALIFAFMKMLDPGSVVREGEFANAQNTAGVPDRIVNAYNRALKGTRLSDRQRNEFFATAATAMDSYTNSVADQSERYRGLAGSYGLSADNVAPAVRRPAAKAAQPSAPIRVNAPAQAVAYLKSNPNTRAQFDAKYGKGASAAVLGR